MIARYRLQIDEMIKVRSLRKFLDQLDRVQALHISNMINNGKKNKSLYRLLESLPSYGQLCSSSCSFQFKWNRPLDRNTPRPLENVTQYIHSFYGRECLFKSVCYENYRFLSEVYMQYTRFISLNVYNCCYHCFYDYNCYCNLSLLMYVAP